MLIASMLIAQIVISASSRPLSPDEAVRVLRASRSTADLTDLRLAAVPEQPMPSVFVPWWPGDGPFGPFDQRLTQLDFLQRGSTPWIYGGYNAPGRFAVPGFHGWPRMYREPFAGRLRAPGRSRVKR